MEFNKLQDKTRKLHNRQSVRDIEAKALVPFLAVGAVGYVAVNLAKQTLESATEKVRSKIDAIDNSSLQSQNLRVKRIFDPNPETIRDSSFPPVTKIDHTITASEAGIPIGHEQQGDVL